MTVARKIKYVIPAEARAFIKGKFPRSVEKLAIGLDTIPLLMSTSALRRLLQPNPNQRLHPLASKLWTGFGDKASKELELSKLSGQRDKKILAATAWSLAKWYAHQGDYDRALENLILMTTAIPRMSRNTYTQLMIVECLLRLNRPDEAQQWLDQASKGTNLRAEYYFSASNIRYELARHAGSVAAADVERLAWLNQVYEESGFAPLQKLDATRPLMLDNITANHPHSVDAKVKLSILMPAYNCADTLPIALRSILSQTWHNLEVIIVDDRSQDGTWDIIESFAKRDGRIIPLRHEQNRGAYAARNTALAHATGEFVTVHDADDWSHPEKFAIQMGYALTQPDGLSTTMGVRASMDLRFDVKVNMAGMLMENTSSLLVRREILTALGGWDVTRLGADSELYERIKAKHNLTTNKLFPATPLTLILFSGTSLTQTKAAGIATVNYGARRQYKEAYRFWHATEMGKPNPDFRMTAERRFPAPRIILGQKDLIQDIDLVIIGNFADDKRPLERDIIGWERLKLQGIKLGLVHWPSYRRAEADIVSTVRSAIATGLVENIVPGETVSCSAATFLDPILLGTPPAPFPTISPRLLFLATETALTVEQETAARHHFGATRHILAQDYVAAALEYLSDKIPNGVVETNFQRS